MSLLDWEKKKYERALEEIEQRRRGVGDDLLEKARDLGDKSYDFHADAAFDEAVRESLKPPFRVVVQPMQASNGLSYFVTLIRTDGERVPTFRHEGRMSVINRHVVEEANAEGYAWAAFLGVPFVPCEAVTDTAEKNTVPEYGVPVHAQLPTPPDQEG